MCNCDISRISELGPRNESQVSHFNDLNHINGARASVTLW